MTITDYLLNGLLIALVIRQIRGRRLDAVNVLLPLGLVAFAASKFLLPIPTAGNDVWLELAGAGAGLVLGVACALTTRVQTHPGAAPFVQAGPAAAALWVLGIGARLGFALYATHGGAPAIGRFSVAHHITSGHAFVASLVLMGLAEVVARLAVLVIRSRLWTQLAPASAPSMALR
jgi:hypothetical protein